MKDEGLGLPGRILLAKVGLDGHDRGIKVLARHLRDAGMEVIYTGLWQTPANTVKAAIEEDVDVLGASFHSAAHLTLVPRIVRELEAIGRLDMPLVIGGIIPPRDLSPMKDAGAAAIFGPESPLDAMVAEIRQLTEAVHRRRGKAVRNGELDDWITSARQGNAAALGRVLTWAENESADAVGRRLANAQNDTLIVGLTGAPGVGKSTLIGQLLKELRSRNKRVAVIAVDPASPITGGALLGDRARMTLSVGDSGVFIRSSASRGQLGGVAPSTGSMIQALKLAQVDVVIVETVGAGQNDVAVRQWASPLVLLLMPGAGDELQLEKAGITEVADVFVINKADMPGADRLEAQIRETLGGERPVIQTVAAHGDGVAGLADVLLAEN